MNESQSDESIKTLLVLLEKAEQILSIINLSDGIVKKYNQLKEMTYDKLGMDFRPLVKKSLDGGINNNTRQDSRDPREKIQNENFLWDLLNHTRVINNRKNMIIDFLFELIEKFKFENNSYVKQMLSERENILQIQLEKINSTSTLN
jgi:hypothetical protein